MPKERFTDTDHNGFAIREFKADPLSSDPSGAGLYAGRVWYNTTSNALKFYDGTSVVVVGSGTSHAEVGTYVGLLDAALMAWPTTGSADSDSGILAGDTWKVSTDGDIGTKSLVTGDLVIALVDDATNDADFHVVAGTRVDLTPYSREEVQNNVSFTADVELTVTASNLSAIRDAEVYRSTDTGTRFEKITDGVAVKLDASDGTKCYITIGVSLTGARVVLQGTSA